MLKRAATHFLIVGVGFSFAIAWLLTLVVNGTIGSALHAVLGTPPERFFIVSASLTVVAIAIITLSSILGNRLYLRWHRRGSLSTSSLLLSTLLFTAIAIWRFGPQVGIAFGTASSHTLYFHHHGWELRGMLSLPLARLVVIPLIYFLVGRSATVASAPASSSPVTASRESA